MSISEVTVTDLSPAGVHTLAKPSLPALITAAGCGTHVSDTAAHAAAVAALAAAAAVVLLLVLIVLSLECAGHSLAAVCTGTAGAAACRVTAARLLWLRTVQQKRCRQNSTMSQQWLAICCA
jgi:hypothetical protein